eukprot:5553589-Pyramimonas_sp.AAC.1
MRRRRRRRRSGEVQCVLVLEVGLGVSTWSRGVWRRSGYEEEEDEDEDEDDYDDAADDDED